MMQRTQKESVLLYFVLHSITVIRWISAWNQYQGEPLTIKPWLNQKDLTPAWLLSPTNFFALSIYCIASALTFNRLLVQDPGFVNRGKPQKTFSPINAQLSCRYCFIVDDLPPMSRFDMLQ